MKNIERSISVVVKANKVARRLGLLNRTLKELESLLQDVEFPPGEWGVLDRAKNIIQDRLNEELE